MWRNYLVTAVRHLTRNRLYAAISIASLTVGFGVVVLVAIFVRHEVSYDRFLPDYDRLYVARQTLYPPAHGPPWRSNATRNDIAQYLKGDFSQVEAVTRLQVGHTAGVRRGDVVYTESGLAYADPNLLEVLKLPLEAGDPRGALAEPGDVVLTKTLARKYFGGADPIGQALTLHSLDNGAISGKLGPPVTYRVTAVLKDLPSETHLSTQIFTAEPTEDRADPPATYGQEAITYVRLARGASPAALNRELPPFVARHIPSGPLMGSGFGLQLVPIAELHLPRVKLDNPGDINPNGDRGVLEAIAGIGLLVMVTAAINFVGLMTARASQRAVEIGVRKSMGARRADLVAQFMGEALIQVLVALVLALAVGELLAPWLGERLGRSLGLDYISDGPFLGALAAAAVLVGLAAGLYPSLVLAGFRPASALRGGVGLGSWSGGLRQALVVAQFAILVLLMIVIATVWRQTRLAFDNALRLRGDQVLLINGRPICGTAFEDQVRALPGVRAAVCSANVVFSNNGAEGAALAHDGRSLPIELGPVEAGFFEFYGLHPIAGRVFDARRPGDQPLIHGPDAEASPPVVLNATAARRMGFVTPQSAVGRSIRWDRRHVWFSDGEFHAKVLHNQNAEVLGVVPDYGGTSRSAVKPMIYWVDPQLMATLSVKVSGSAAPGLLADVNRIWRAAGHFRAADTQFFDEKVRKAYRDVLVLGEVVAACAGLALALACIGLFGLASYTTERRTKEFGIRKAMGAGTADIAALLIWQFSKPVLLACAIAAPAGYVAMHWWLQGFADRVALTPASFVAVFAVTLIIAWATVLTHAWRVACTRPVTALRYE